MMQNKHGVHDISNVSNDMVVVQWIIQFIKNKTKLNKLYMIDKPCRRQLIVWNTSNIEIFDWYVF